MRRLDSDIGDTGERQESARNRHLEGVGNCRANNPCSIEHRQGARLLQVDERRFQAYAVFRYRIAEHTAVSLYKGFKPFSRDGAYL